MTNAEPIYAHIYNGHDADYAISCPETDRVETVKSILENNDAIQKELMNVIGSIDEAIYGTRTNANMEKEAPDISLLDTLKRQRNYNERILKAIVRIKEALW